MPIFAYKAYDQQGTLVSATQEAADEQVLARELDLQGLSVISVAAAKQSLSATDNLLERFSNKEKTEVIIFTRQLATLLRAGIALSPALQTIAEQTTHKRFKTVVEQVRSDVQAGENFSQSLAKHRSCFSELFTSMIEVGEAAGMLDRVLARLAALGTQEMEMRSKLSSALIYPVVLVSIAFLVVNFLFIGVLPKFVGVFKASGAALPLPTQIVLGISWVLQRMWLVIIILIAAGIGWFINYMKTEEGKFKVHTKFLRLPIFGPLYSKVQIARFCRILAALIASGVPLLQALEVVEKTISNVILRRTIANIRSAISEGRPLVEPFQQSGMFSPLVVQMIGTGEKTGKLDFMLDEIAGFYEPEIEYTVKNMTALLEPFMLLAMGIMVAFIALSVLLPIFNLIQVFRK